MNYLTKIKKYNRLADLFVAKESSRYAICSMLAQDAKLVATNGLWMIVIDGYCPQEEGQYKYLKGDLIKVKEDVTFPQWNQVVPPDNKRETWKESHMFCVKFIAFCVRNDIFVNFFDLNAIANAIMGIGMESYEFHYPADNGTGPLKIVLIDGKIRTSIVIMPFNPASRLPSK